MLDPVERSRSQYLPEKSSDIHIFASVQCSLTDSHPQSIRTQNQESQGEKITRVSDVIVVISCTEVIEVWIRVRYLVHLLR